MTERDTRSTATGTFGHEIDEIEQRRGRQVADGAGRVQGRVQTQFAAPGQHLLDEPGLQQRLAARERHAAAGGDPVASGVMELWEVDVFADGPLSGNPLAVVRADDADELPTTERMLAFTRWQGFSETTFLVPPTRGDADYGVRIFTPARELPFAGHPTIGTCHAWLEAGGTPHDSDVVVQECGVGLVRVRRGDDGRLAFAAPSLVRSGPVEGDRLAEVLEVVGVADAEVVDAAWVDNGPGWLALLLRDVQAVLAVDADFTRWRRDEPLMIGLVGLHEGEVDPRLEVRALFNDEHGRMIEDPVTGSLNASVAQWLLATGRVTAPYTARQGTRVGRRGRVDITSDHGQVWVGGATSTVAVGRLML